MFRFILLFIKLDGPKGMVYTYKLQLYEFSDFIGVQKQ